MQFLTHSDLYTFLEENHRKYNTPDYIDTDPIQIPHAFSQKENIEIAGFLAATLAWGNRKAIIKSSKQLIALLNNNPYDFICNADKCDFEHLRQFIYRTFNGIDTHYFLQSLRNIYIKHNGLEAVFTSAYIQNHSIYDALKHFRAIFFELAHENRTQKHIANVSKNSSCKRLNMFLRWMVRNDKTGVDLGIWNTIKPSDLYIPLDLHSGKVARELGLLTRTQDDWKAVVELTSLLKQFDPADPIKYDFALFGYSAFEGKRL